MTQEPPEPVLKCRHCGAKATVHLSEPSEDEGVQEWHLCRACARRAGLLAAPEADLGLDAVIQKLVLDHVGELVGQLARTTCPYCGLSFMEFRIAGRLGCPGDYAMFSSGLTPMLRRHHGASRHVGKLPRRRGFGDDRLRLRAALRQAVAGEDYEEAARLRDLLRHKETDA